MCGENKGWERRGEEEGMGLQLNCYMLHPVSSKRDKMHVINQTYLASRGMLC